MATASKKSRGAPQLRRRLPKASTAGSMEFVIVEYNDGSGLFDRRAGAADPIDLLAGRSFSSEAVATWPAGR